MKNKFDMTKQQAKAIQRFRKTAPWGIYSGHLFMLNPDRTAVAFVRPLEFDGTPARNVNLDPYAALCDAYEIDLEKCEFRRLPDYAPLDIDAKDSNSRALENYLHPWTSKDAGRITPEGQTIGVGTWKAAADIFNAFGVKKIRAEYHAAFQYWEGQNRDICVICVTMGMR